jgi:hypothetical protein
VARSLDLWRGPRECYGAGVARLAQRESEDTLEQLEKNPSTFAENFVWAPDWMLPLLLDLEDVRIFILLQRTPPESQRNLLNV